MSKPPPQSKRILLGLSGASASGKTTIARLARSILPPSRIRVIILHQDDFFLPEASLPVVPDGAGGNLVDWDSAASLDLASMAIAIRHLRDTGEVPRGFKSKEDRNAVGPSGVSDETVAELQKEVAGWFGSQQPDKGVTELFIIDGFLLFGTSTAQIRELMDIRLLLRATYAKAKERRENRPGYATIEGFWTDPPGYWDKVVWPAYVREHKFLFEGGDVEGEVDAKVAEDVGVRVLPGGGEGDVEMGLRWVLGEIREMLLGR